MMDMNESQLMMAKKSVYEGYNIKVPFWIARHVVEMFGAAGWELLERTYKEFVKMPEGSITKTNMSRLSVLLVKNVAESFGDRGWEALDKAAEDFARYRAPLMKFLVDEPDNARSLGKIFDFEDNLGMLENEWIKTGDKEAIKIETKCPGSAIYKEYPPFCGRFLYVIARETLRAINPNVHLEPFDKVKCIVYGDDCCEVKISLPGKDIQN